MEVLVTMAMMSPLGQVHSLVNRYNNVLDTAVIADFRRQTIDSETDRKTDSKTEVSVNVIFFK